MIITRESALTSQGCRKIGKKFETKEYPSPKAETAEKLAIGKHLELIFESGGVTANKILIGERMENRVDTFVLLLSRASK